MLAERSDTKSKVKLGGFQSHLQASYVSSHTEELWYNESLSVDDNIYIFNLFAKDEEHWTQDQFLIGVSTALNWEFSFLWTGCHIIYQFLERE